MPERQKSEDRDQMSGKISRHQFELIYRALRQHDGNTLCPHWDIISRRELSLALDKLRSAILIKLDDGQAQGPAPTMEV
jgi:hypothetical protein